MASKKASGAGGASGGGGTECVKVAVRLRPQNSKERDAGELPCVTVDSARAQVVVVKPGESSEDTKPFTFDYTYGPDSTQEKVFQETAQPIVDSVLAGYNGTMFAYGQTGTGKTHTMEGVMDDEKLRGVMPNSFHYIMAAVKNTGKNVEFLVRMSFLEIYKEEVFDLLNKAERKKAEVRENPESGVFVDGLSTYVVKSVDDMMKVLKRGQKSRKVGATAMNAGSSRSHSILTIIVETSELKDADEAKAAAPGTETKNDTKYRAGKLNLVDLAGSERQKKTAAEGERLLEAKSINQSLSALGNVIKALVNAKATHIPFRDSKLTRLLQDSLGGNTKTVMIAALGPSPESWDETMSTLRYADRAKNIKNKPRVNEDPKDTMLRECQEEIARLKAALEARARSMGPDGLMLTAPGGGGGGSGAPGAAGGGGFQSAPAGPPVIQEEIVEKEVVVDTGIREEHLTELEKKALEEAEHFNQKTEAEKQIILERKKIAEETARRFEEDLKAKNELMEKERAEFAAIQQRIADREKQLMSGGVELEKAAAQKKELKRAEAELNARREREAQLKRELQKAQDDELFMNETFKTAEEEVANKTQKMKQLMAKYTEKKQEIDDLQEDFEVEREDLVDTIRALDRQIKLKHLVLDAFVPPHYVEMIEQRALFDERGDTWIIPGVELACNNIRRDLAPGGAASAGAALIGGGGAAGGGGGPSGRMFRRPPTPNWARLGGPQLMAGAGRGMPFDPTRPLELPPDMQQALAAAMQAEDGPRAPKDMYYTYGGAGAEQTEETAGRGGRRKRR